MENKLLNDVRKVLDQAYYDGYSIEQYPTDEELIKYLDQDDEISIHEIDGDEIIWFSDLYTEGKNQKEDVIYNSTKNEFIPLKEFPYYHEEIKYIVSVWVDNECHRQTDAETYEFDNLEDARVKFDELVSDLDDYDFEDFKYVFNNKNIDIHDDGYINISLDRCGEFEAETIDAKRYDYEDFFANEDEDED